MSPLTIVGVDPALSVTGVANAELATTIRPRRGDKRYARHWRVATTTLNFALHSGADLVILEDYAPNSLGINSTIVAGEIGGLIRTLFTVRALPFVEVRPNTLKRYATGKGNADKAAMVDAAERRLGHRLEGVKVDDLADALFLRDLGAWLYRLPAVGPAGDFDAHPFAAWPTPAELRAAALERAALGRATIETLEARTV